MKTLYRKIEVLSLMLVITLSTIALITIPQDNDVEANISDPDDYGYYWVDNKDPDPKVEYSWIDATTGGTKISDSMYSSSSYTTVSLPFNFTYYGNTYDTVYVTSRGYVSFVDTYVTTSYRKLPSSGSPHGTIAVYWAYPYYYRYTSGGIWTLSGTTSDGVRYFVVEWERGAYDLTYEAIFYETGEIKFQYKDTQATSSSYSNGGYTTVGIEDPTDTYGITYSYNQKIINNGLAILFTPYHPKVSVTLTDGHGSDGHVVLAGYRYYNLHVDVYLDGGVNRFKSLFLYFGEVSSYILIRYSFSSGLMNLSAINPENEYIKLDVLNSSFMSDGVTNWSFDLKVWFSPDFPLGGNLSVQYFILTSSAGVGMGEIPDVFFLENTYAFIGNMKAYVDPGNGWEEVSYNSWVRDRIPLRFTGQKLIYNCTQNDTLFPQVISPPNSAFYVMLVDENGVTYYDNSSSGREYDFILNTGSEGKSKVFEIRVGIIPGENVINKPSSFILRVDDDIPPPPSGFIIHADSFRDPQTEVDNDDELFLTWLKTADRLSGVRGYYINDTINLSNPQGIFVSGDNDRFVWNRSEEGEYNLFIWAEDRVGHLSKPVRAKILIDKDEVEFFDFVVGPMGVNGWITSTSPTCIIKVKDYGGSGVFGDTVEYQYSPGGLENMTDWIPADLFGVKDEFNVEIHPQLDDGPENYIKFRAMDFAGNGYTYSELFQLKVDSEPVGFRDIFPSTNVWWPSTTVTVNITLFDTTSGVDLNTIYYRYSKNNGINWTDWTKYTPEPGQIIDDGREVHISIVLELPEGDQNLIQFRANDIAGNGVIESEKYVIKVNTKPNVIISSPESGAVFYENDVITFDASLTSDYDGDPLTFTWYDNDKPLSDRPSFETTLLVGEHVIRLEVYDGVHTISKQIRISVNKTELPPPGVDKDNDGMEDRKEIIWGLDPTNPYDAELDSDGDLFTNREELENDTNPFDRAEHPTIQTTPETPEEKKPFLDLMGIMVLIVAGVIALLAIIVIYSWMLRRREQEEVLAEQEEDNLLEAGNIQAALPPPPVPPEAPPVGEAPPEGEIPPEQYPPEAPPEGYAPPEGFPEGAPPTQ